MKSLLEYIIQARISEAQKKISVGQFIDDFRRTQDLKSIEHPLFEQDEIAKLFEAIAHQLCLDLGLACPDWLNKPTYLQNPYFVSKLPGSKFIALRDSPYAFKIRNIFVPFNYLNRV